VHPATSRHLHRAGGKPALITGLPPQTSIRLLNTSGLGAKNAALVVSAGAAVKQVVASEAARAGNMSDEFA